MKRKFLLMAVSACAAASLALVGVGCQQQPAQESAPAEDQAATQAAANPDQAAADEVAALIDGIYVQEWTPDTPEKCAAAKAAWDALTPAQQQLVAGENADPDYFGRDTGDASKDDPLNADQIGENEILVVSFGTSFNDSRVADIGGIEKAIAAAFPDWSVRRAFTAQIIMNHVLARDGEAIDNVTQALDRAVASGVKNLIVAPTHLMHGAEYDELVAALKPYEDKMTIVVSEPLLGEVGADATVVNADKETVAKAVVAAAAKAAGFGSIEDADKAGVAFVLMGHGTSHEANVTYDQMQTVMDKLGYKNVFIGTVEGEPKDTECSAVIDKVKNAGYKKVILRPLMVVAGDHANNDMADPEDPESWLSQFTASGNFTDGVECQIAGLGEIPDVQKVYVDHVTAVVPAK
jgi:cobalamin biosynthesis Co2+ chelatase CbiK